MGRFQRLLSPSAMTGNSDATLKSSLAKMLSRDSASSSNSFEKSRCGNKSSRWRGRDSSIEITFLIDDAVAVDVLIDFLPPSSAKLCMLSQWAPSEHFPLAHMGHNRDAFSDNPSAILNSWTPWANLQSLEAQRLSWTDIAQKTNDHTL